MIALGLAVLIPPIAAGYAIAARRIGGGAFALCIGTGLGLSLAAATAWLPGYAALAVESALAAGLLWWWRPALPVERPRSWWLPALFGVGLFIALAGLAADLARAPHGGSDAWEVWGLRARFLFRGGDAFSNQLRLHLDYPILAPLLSVRGWRILGETQAVPGAVAMVFAAAAAGVVASAAGGVRGTVAALLLVATPLFWTQAATLYADVPLAFFFAATIALLARGEVALAGAMAGAGVFTKNEGGLLAGVAFAAWLAMSREWRRSWMYWAAAAPGIAAALWVKAIAPRIDTFGAGPQAGTLAGRAVESLKSYGAGIAGFGGPPVYPLAALLAIGFLLGWKKDRAAFAGLASVALAIAGSILVGVAMSSEIQWQLSNSTSRLLMQLWPAALIAASLAMKEPEWQKSPEKKPARKKKR